MKKLSRKQRQSMPQIKPDHSSIVYPVPHDHYWDFIMQGKPLMRYKTESLSGDVVTLIKTLDTIHTNCEQHVFFERTPTHQEDTGIRYPFYIEYWNFMVRRGSFKAEWIKQGHVDGAVISGTEYTTIEYRSTFSQGNPLIAMLSPGWLFLVLCSIAATLQSLTFWIKDGPGLSFLMNLTCGIVLVLMIIPVLALMGMGLRRNEFMLMDDVVKKLEAIKLEEPLKSTRKNNDVVINE